MELFNKIQKVETPGYLRSRIEGALENAKVLVPTKLIYLYATVLMVFVIFQLSQSKRSPKSNDIETYASFMGINPNESSYYE